MHKLAKLMAASGILGAVSFGAAQAAIVDLGTLAVPSAASARFTISASDLAGTDTIRFDLPSRAQLKLVIPTGQSMDGITFDLYRKGRSKDVKVNKGEKLAASTAALQSGSYYLVVHRDAAQGEAAGRYDVAVTASASEQPPISGWMMAAAIAALLAVSRRRRTSLSVERAYD